MKRFYLIGISVLFCASLISQGVAIKSAGAIPGSVALELGDSDKGFLMPRMDSTAKVGILAPANGLWMFQDKQDSGFYYYDADYWRRAHQTFGTVQMDNLSSKVISGQGFTVVHRASGVDDIYYRHYLGEAVFKKPEVIVTAEASELPLGKHDNEANYCIESSYPACNTYYMSAFALSNLTTGANNIITSGTACNNNEYYRHGLVDNSIENCISTGDVLQVIVNIVGAEATRWIKIWIDFDGDGDFEPSEFVYNTPPIAPGANIGPNIIVLPAWPGGAIQGKFTRMRVMVSNWSPTNDDACITSNGSTQKAEVEDYYIPTCSGSFEVANGPFCSLGAADTGTNNSSFRVYCEDSNGNAVNVKYHFKVHEK